MTEKLFSTQLENKRDIAVVVREYGRILLTLKPGDVRHIEARSPICTYSRWSKIVFSGIDKIHLDENKEWSFPWPDQLMLEVLNTDGQACESLSFNGKYYDFYKGIPRFIPILHSDEKWYSVAKLEKRLVAKKIRDGDYFITKMVLENIKTLRSKKEIRAIEQRVLAEATERAEKETKKRFFKPRDDASE